ncbi:hypothetical protein [uncultured Methanobrevibacter sp.]|jgi:hypothetical protein|nr:hypothetical protein [uncultured Methanobrevibacter sp.]
MLTPNVMPIAIDCKTSIPINWLKISKACISILSNIIPADISSDLSDTLK